jgi:uncharacterized damage-inducible protein DinB
MALNQALIGEFNHESRNSRRILERVKAEHFDWKPHAKSMSLKKLATHIADLPRWINVSLDQSALDFSTHKQIQPDIQTVADLIAYFDEVQGKALSALEQATDEQLQSLFTLSNGGHVLFTMPKIAVMRYMVFNHIVHHRGQLSVYLRLLDIPVPGLYGPSADE